MSRAERRRRRVAAAEERYARSVEQLVMRQYRLIGAANLAARFGAEHLVLRRSASGGDLAVLMVQDGTTLDLGDRAPRLAEFTRRCARGLLSPGEVMTVEPLASCPG